MHTVDYQHTVMSDKNKVLSKKEIAGGRRHSAKKHLGLEPV